ncbi:hypothetical protein [Vibrio maritimus]|uniref:hypothetical protein n=1 Tax=Vibrio maritimus TaxID=990268 RepID=UPI001F2CBB5F|nr:hypothetical protein [Vibrio maritimus]
MNSRNEFYIVVGGRILTTLVSLLSVRLLTSQLDASQVGLYYIIQTVIMLVSFALLNAISEYYNRNIHNSYESGAFFSSSIKLMLLRFSLVGVSIFPIVAVYYFFDYSEQIQLTQFLGIVVLSLIAGSSLVFLEALNIVEDRVYYTVVGLIQLLVGVLLALTLTHFIEGVALWWLVGIASSQLLFFPFVMHRIAKHSRQKPLSSEYVCFLSSSQRKKVLSFAIPVSIVLFLQWGQISSYRLILGENYTLDILGFVAVGVAVASAVFTAVEAISRQYLGPRFYREISKSEREDRALIWNDYAKIVIPIYVVTLFFTVFLSKEILVILVDSKFQLAWSFVMVGAFIEFFRASSYVVYTVTSSELQSKKAVLPYLSGFLVMAALLSISDLNQEPLFSMLIIAFSYAITFLVLYVEMKKMLPIVFPWKEVILPSVISLLFSLSLFFDVEFSLVFSLVKTAAFGLLYISIVFFLIKKVSKENRLLGLYRA